MLRKGNSFTKSKGRENSRKLYFRFLCFTSAEGHLTTIGTQHNKIKQVTHALKYKLNPETASVYIFIKNIMLIFCLFVFNLQDLYFRFVAEFASKLPSEFIPKFGTFLNKETHGIWTYFMQDIISCPDPHSF